MNRKKNMKSTYYLIIFLLTIFASISTIDATTQKKNDSNKNFHSLDWLDATDKSIFGIYALQKNSIENQSSNLQIVIDQANKQTKQLYIPAGTYIINASVNLRSGIKIKGDSQEPTILKNTTKENVILSDENYQTSQNIEIHQLFFEGVGIFTRVANDIVINDNIFYNPVSLYPVNLLTSVGATVKNNIFMRDSEHSTPDTENRAIYIGGFATTGRYEYMENVSITDNLFGLRINELDAIKSFSNDSIILTINRLQYALNSEKIRLKNNEQNYLSTGVNSYNNLKNALIKNNFFQQMYENEDRFDVQGDHAIYLRGSQDVQVIGNHVRGLQNGSYGGLKFKSGRNITIMNNYIRNTGIIMYETPEFGLGDSYIRVPELSNWLVANNIFDFKKWQDKYGIGIVYNRHTGIDNVSNGVFIDNQYINYHNIPANRRRELLIMNRELEGFKGETTFVSGNIRDDTVDEVLDVEFWSTEEYQNMPDNWQFLIDPMIYEQYKNVKIPVRNTFPVGRDVELILGEPYDLFIFVDSTHDLDEEEPNLTIVNPEILTQIGQHQVELVLSYTDGSEVRVFSNVKIIRSPNEEDL
ncbi:glycosyl hydrolase family 28-related protein [Carnobacterium maltaromaticum]|uniref:glycosyl hydrolase family 28-related protein n=1 Tax=Carnobacterium maltaromaticum TaxID=2751 RepID=UPI0039BDF07F